ncbi:MAG TPA: SPFH domain-containing protein [Gemmatimonadales bacterium]|nr:SPFH domain-containing protein [Gemmatimonadales bacterium]
MSVSFFQLVLLAGAFVVVVYVSKAIRIVQQAQTMVIERLGKYHKTLSSGLNFINPLLDKPRAIDWHQVIQTPAGESFARHFRTDKIDLRETVYVFPRQNVITKDNVVVEIDALIYSQITDPVRATYEIANLPDAIEKLTQTTLRNVIGEMELDHVLSSRDTINAKLREILDEATHKWGAKVSRVELKDINPPRDIRDAMEKQMRAERDRRAAILTAEAEKQSRILQAEGIRQSEINKAEGDKQAKILAAEAEATARLKVADAEAQAIERITGAIKGTGGDPARYLIAVRYIEALKDMVTSPQSNKVIYLPYEATGVLSSLGGIREMLAAGPGPGPDKGDKR